MALAAVTGAPVLELDEVSYARDHEAHAQEDEAYDQADLNGQTRNFSGALDLVILINCSCDQEAAAVRAVEAGGQPQEPGERPHDQLHARAEALLKELDGGAASVGLHVCHGEEHDRHVHVLDESLGVGERTVEQLPADDVDDQMTTTNRRPMPARYDRHLVNAVQRRSNLPNRVSGNSGGDISPLFQAAWASSASPQVRFGLRVLAVPYPPGQTKRALALRAPVNLSFLE